MNRINMLTRTQKFVNCRRFAFYGSGSKRTSFFLTYLAFEIVAHSKIDTTLIKQ